MARNNNASTDGAFYFLKGTAESVQEDFDELIDLSSDKKRFLKALPKIFALLLNTNVSNIEKIKTIIKIAIETTQKNTAKTKATVRRFPAVESCNMRGALKPFKIEEILLQQKTVDI